MVKGNGGFLIQARVGAETGRDHREGFRFYLEMITSDEPVHIQARPSRQRSKAVHVRVLALRDSGQSRGADPAFLCYSLPGALASLPLPIKSGVESVAVEPRSLDHVSLLAVAILKAVGIVWW